MHSLYYVLTDQHREEFAPVRCNEQTVTRLVRYFEDVVTENRLSALVLEGRCLNGDAEREKKRLDSLTNASRRVYLFSCDGECVERSWKPDTPDRLTAMQECDYHGIETGPFILVMEPRFCGLLASSLVLGEKNSHTRAYDMVWTFDPNVVFTAIEYLMARVGVQTPRERQRFETLVNACTTRSSSLRLALTLTTKVTMLMQRQNELEMATNRISSAISGTLELEPMLQTAVDEVGRALGARRAALVLWQEGTKMPEGMSIYERPEESERDGSEAPSHLSATDKLSLSSYKNGATSELPGFEPPSPAAVSDIFQTRTVIGSNGDARSSTPCSLELPITYRTDVIGTLLIEDDTPLRNWEDEEVLMVKTVSDQLSVAISHVRLFRQVQKQAMTDALTGLYNHGHFQDRIDRETKLADRKNEQVSLILLDLDHLKRINDTHGHRSGDRTLNHVASIMKKTVRETDVCARYGGEEFVVILPECDRENAMVAAERLREAIASTPVPRVGQVTASLGVATYPSGAKNKDELVEMADRAMYLAKAAGRNRVRTLAHRSYTGIDVI
ncbi:MAG TPA: sensor domain-containing diguanylate cyclase [Blastocatellia bacterium]|nr:sensor domain-containing diguanylate cyclase [Blastocatellia bacterium]